MGAIRGLAVIDGDLVVSAGDYLTLSGLPRVQQDLSFALHDAYGADPYHPYWGSILERFIGEPLVPGLQQQVQNEVRRVVSNYIAVQTDRINLMSSQNSRSTYDASDVVTAISDITVTPSLDSLIVTVSLTTMSQATVTLSQTITV